MRNHNILITSAGSVNAVNVIQALKKELGWQKHYPKDVEQILMRLIGVDADPLAAGIFLADKGHVVPKVDDPKFIPELLKICKKERVKIVIPISSYELPIIAKNKNRFDKIGVKMAISESHVYKRTEDKLETALLFEMLDIPTPKIYLNEVKFPAIVKPITGSGSKGIHKVNNEKELNFYRNENTIVQEFIKGQEYTIDGLCDLNGDMLYALPRKRLDVKCGMCIKAETEYNQEMIDYSRKIVEGIGLIGAFNIQCIKCIKNDKLYFIEINNRFGSGGLPLAVAVGLNIPYDIIKLLLNKKVSVFRDKKPWLYKGTMIRYNMSIIRR